MSALGSSVKIFLARSWRWLRWIIAILVIAYIAFVIFRIPATEQFAIDQNKIQVLAIPNELTLGIDTVARGCPLDKCPTIITYEKGTTLTIDETYNNKTWYRTRAPDKDQTTWIRRPL